MFGLPLEVSPQRIQDRRSLLHTFDQMQRQVDDSGAASGLDHYRRQAIEMVVEGRVRDAFDLAREPAPVREHYGKHLWCQQALLARRLVEAGVAFVTLDLSYHTASGTWDTLVFRSMTVRGASCRSSPAASSSAPPPAPRCSGLDLVPSVRALAPERVDVLVIGAGVAGLAAARELKRHKKKVLVLEGAIGSAAASGRIDH